MYTRDIFPFLPVSYRKGKWQEFVTLAARVKRDGYILGVTVDMGSMVEKKMQR